MGYDWELEREKDKAREAGWYWVKTEAHWEPKGYEWNIWEWQSHRNDWSYIGEDMPNYPEILEINETRIPNPDELIDESTYLKGYYVFQCAALPRRIKIGRFLRSL